MGLPKSPDLLRTAGQCSFTAVPGGQQTASHLRGVLQRWESCESQREGFRVGDALTRPFRDARRFPSTRV
jgi:hypothetical protein